MRDRLAERAAQLGKHLRAGLVQLQTKHKVIGDIRGRGLLQGIEIVAPDNIAIALQGDKLGALIADRAMELGLSCNVVNLDGFAGVFRIAPPLVVTDVEMHRGLDILDAAFTDVLETVKHSDAQSLANGTRTPISIA